MRKRPTSVDWSISLGGLLKRAAGRWPSGEALVIDDSRMTFGELYSAACDLATRLQRRGASPGTHIALMGYNSCEWVVGYFAIALAGGVTVPVNPRFSAREIRFVLRKSRCAMLLVQQGLASILGTAFSDKDDTLPALPLGVCEYTAGPDAFVQVGGPDSHRLPNVHADSLAVIMFTSGSTAFPKGCMLNHLGLIRNAYLHAHRLHLTPADRWYGPTPFFHASGCVWGILSVVVSGACLVSGGRFDAERSLEILEAEQCTYQHGIDTIFVRQLDVLRRRNFDLSHLTKATSTGSLSLLKRIRDEMGIEHIMSKWGASEGYGNLSLCDLDDPIDAKLGTHGRVYDEFEYRIVDPETGEVLPGDAVGEIQVRGPAMMGYFDEPEATAATILPDGWLRTGDLGRLALPYLHYVGRIKDMLKIGGENVAASEIEAALLSHEAVLNAAVVGISDPEWGEAAVAFIESVDGHMATEDELIAHCRRLLAGIKVPRKIVVVDELPRTGSGKVDKKQLVVPPNLMG